jgi:KaiC/GvpD/RAD55 family RecA-like ATPase
VKAWTIGDWQSEIAHLDKKRAERAAELAKNSPAVTPAKPTAAAFSFASVGESLRAGLKPVQWLVRNYIESDSLALMFGDPGCGKSFAAIDLACCVATGTPWHTNKTNPGAVFYIAGEGQNGLMRRFAAWSQHNEVLLIDAPLFIGHRPAQLCNAAAAAEVANAVGELQAACGHNPALIVVDTLARNFGGDENNQEDMGAFIGNIDAFLRKSGEWNATVLIVHHSGHADKSRGRGSSALKGAVDAEYSLTKDETGVVRIEATKMKEAEHPQPVAFKMERVTLEGLFDDEDEPVSSVALSSVAHVPPVKGGKVGRGRNQTIALSALAELIEKGRASLERKGFSPDAARVTLEQWRDALRDSGMSKYAVRDVQASLKDAGLIVIVTGGYVELADSPL